MRGRGKEEGSYMISRDYRSDTESTDSTSKCKNVIAHLSTMLFLNKKLSSDIKHCHA